MGCDIHFFVERRDTTINRWVSADSWEMEDDGRTQYVPYQKEYYNDRNYNLFAILADVRNGRGFAGDDMGDGFVPVSMPKGLPGNVSANVEACAKRWNGDGHSHSWLTIRELMEYDWTQTSTLRGWVSGPEFLEWSNWRRGDGAGPKCYCGSVDGPNIEHVPVEEMERRIASIRETISAEQGLNARQIYARVKDRVSATLGLVYCQAQWQSPYYREAGAFLSETMPRLWKLMLDGTGKPEDVRIVFWFDN